ncbi:MAG: type II secretion system protein [Woeseia sp.]
MQSRKSELGATLIELLVSIVIVGVAAGIILSLVATTTGASADPMLRHQASAIAEAYLEEILLKSFDDPDGVDGEGSRAAFDDLDDYDGLVDVGARDQFGNAIPALADYTVSVSVLSSTGLAPVAAGDTLRVDVNVSRGSSINLLLSGYRARF